MKARAEAGIPMEIFTIDIKSGEQRTVHRANDWLNHLQFSPVDPQQLMFCHEGPWHGLDRVWSMRIGDKSPHLVHRRTMNMEIAGHEFFGVDGKTIWYDLQTPRGEVFWLALRIPMAARVTGSMSNGTTGPCTTTSRRTDRSSRATAATPRWWRARRMANGSTCSGRSRWLTSRAFPFPTRTSWCRPGKLRAERLVDMKAHDYRMEPNVIFTPDSKWVVFRSNMHGDAHVYMAEVARATVPGSANTTE